MLLPPPLMLPPPPVLAPPVGRVDGDGEMVATGVTVGVGVGVALGVGLHGFFFDAVVASVFLQGFFFDVAAAVGTFFLHGVFVGVGLGDQELSSPPLLPQLDRSSPELDRSSPELDRSSPELDQPSPELDLSSPGPPPLPWPETETLAAVLATDSVLACAAVPEASNAAAPTAKQPAVKRMRPAIPAPPSRDFSRGSVKNPVSVGKQSVTVARLKWRSRGSFLIADSDN